jgi:hypothetical protein
MRIAGNDTTVNTRQPVKLQGSFKGDSTAKIFWKICELGSFVKSSGDTVFKVPSTPGDMPRKIKIPDLKAGAKIYFSLRNKYGDDIGFTCPEYILVGNN